MKLDRIIIYQTILISLSFLLSCNYNIAKNVESDQEILYNSKYSLSPEKISNLNYALLEQTVFSKNCTSCHGTSGSINLESYSEVLTNLVLIKKSVFFSKSMPKNSTLTEEQLNSLWNWIKIGAPDNSNHNQDPLVATFESINKHVFQTSCKDCHHPAGTGRRVLLDKESLLNSPRELVLPGNPDESGLVLSLERDDDNRMPPASDGYSEVSAEVKIIIREWIKNGAKD